MYWNNKYYIDDNKRLVKKSFINNPISSKATIKELIVVPPKFIIKLLTIYHVKNGHKGIFNLVHDILNDKFYINNIYSLGKGIIKNCVIYSQNRKNIFRKPNIIQIVPKGPKYVYQIDLTEIPIKLQTDENEK